MCSLFGMKDHVEGELVFPLRPLPFTIATVTNFEILFCKMLEKK